MDMLKRLLNVVTIFFVLFLALGIYFGADMYFSNYQKFVEDLPDFVGMVIWMLAAILAFNYIVFKKITLWHR